MDSDICGIYKVQNLIDNKIYIGQSIHIYQRWKEHLRLAKKKKTNFYKDLKKYGEECFSWQIIEIVPASLLNQREKFWIQFYDCKNPKGYNITEGGNGGRYHHNQPGFNNYVNILNNILSGKWFK